jgi:hypothetical protein
VYDPGHGLPKGRTISALINGTLDLYTPSAGWELNRERK